MQSYKSLRFYSNSHEYCSYLLDNSAMFWSHCSDKTWVYKAHPWAVLNGAAIHSPQVAPSNWSPDFFLPRVSETPLSAALSQASFSLAWVWVTRAQGAHARGLESLGLHTNLSKSCLLAQECGSQLSHGLMKQMKRCLVLQKEHLNPSRTLLTALRQKTLLFALYEMGGFGWWFKLD